MKLLLPSTSVFPLNGKPTRTPSLLPWRRPGDILRLAYVDILYDAPYIGMPLEVKSNELKMQFSFKVPISRERLSGDGILSSGYAWQPYLWDL